MTRALALTATLALLAACGVDGPPVPPPAKSAEPAPVALTVTATVETGVAGSF